MDNEDKELVITGLIQCKKLKNSMRKYVPDTKLASIYDDSIREFLLDIKHLKKYKKVYSYMTGLFERNKVTWVQKCSEKNYEYIIIKNGKKQNLDVEKIDEFLERTIKRIEEKM